MIDLIDACIESLARSDDWRELVPAVGTVRHDRGPGLPVEIAPRSEALRSATLDRDPEDSGPYILTLIPVPERRPTLAALERAYGECRRVRSDIGLPARCVITPYERRSRPLVAILLAFPVASGGDEVRVESIALRKDG